MARAVLDTTVLFGAVYSRDASHEEALPILRGVDDGTLPEGVVLEYVLAETLDGLVTNAGHEAAVDFLDRIEENARFHVESTSDDVMATGKALFRQHPSLSFVDACLVAHMRQRETEYIYTFDSDFDRIDGITRLETATNPYDPQ